MLFALSFDADEMSLLLLLGFFTNPDSAHSVRRLGDTKDMEFEISFFIR